MIEVLTVCSGMQGMHDMYFNYGNFVGQSKIVTKLTSKIVVLDTKETKLSLIQIDNLLSLLNCID